MASYLYAVQDATGREIVSAHVDVERVSDVHGEYHSGSSGRIVKLMFEDVEIDQGRADGGLPPFTLYRWPSDDKHTDPVKHPVK